MSYPQTFGQWVKQRRKAYDYTRCALAAQVGCTVSMLEKVEADQRRPSQLLAERLVAQLALDSENRSSLVTWARAGSSEKQLTRHPTLLIPASCFPVPLTPLIGRDDIASALIAQLTDPTVRLLTLLGPPGVGKTRLAIYVAHNLASHFAAGVCVVDLAPIRDSEQVIPALAQALDIRVDAGGSLAAVVRQQLQNQHLLIVLDNFEQVLSAAPQLAALLSAAPTVQILVTSRARLQLTVEQCVDVAPLAVPNLEMLPPYDQLAQIPAVALFLARTRAVCPTFELTPLNASAIAALCVRLDGLPLAIELAAAQSRVFAPTQLLERLNCRLALLTTGYSDRPARQQTLRATLDWSHALLTPEAQTFLARLAVFVGSTTVDAIEAICTSVGEQTINVLQSLTILSNQGLIQMEAAADGEWHYRLLETVREYALEQLTSSQEWMPLRQQHAAYYLQLAKAAAIELNSAAQQTWVSQLTAAHANLRAALQWAVEIGDGQVLVRLSSALQWYWRMTTQWQDGREWVRAVQNHWASIPPTLHAQAWHLMGVWASLENRYRDAAEYLEASWAALRVSTVLKSDMSVLNELGSLARELGQYNRANVLHQERLEAALASGDREGMADALGAFSATALVQGQLEEAETHLNRCQVLCQMLENHYGMLWVARDRGRIAIERGQLAEAQTWVAQGREHAKAIGPTVGMGSLAYLEARIALRQGDYRQAAACLADCLIRYRTVGAWPSAMDGIVVISCITLEQGEATRAVQWCSAITTIRTRWGLACHPLDAPLWDQIKQAAQEQLGMKRWAAAWTVGATLSLESVVQDALEQCAAWAGAGVDRLMTRSLS
jgi:predicted ATPase/transcriptional regulator with XRE-family HTH domain